jgi:hypothetical protein
MGGMCPMLLPPLYSPRYTGDKTDTISCKITHRENTAIPLYKTRDFHYFSIFLIENAHSHLLYYVRD